MLWCRYWQVALDGVSVGGVPVSVTATNAILDTSTTAMTVGLLDGAAIHSVIFFNYPLPSLMPSNPGFPRRIEHPLGWAVWYGMWTFKISRREARLEEERGGFLHGREVGGAPHNCCKDTGSWGVLAKLHGSGILSPLKGHISYHGSQSGARYPWTS